MSKETGKDTASRIPELLAPAGDWDCARAAVENGADAIYFGLERFNARMRANNFTLADLPGLIAYLHRRGVRAYVTFNTLVFSPEIPEAIDYLQKIIASGVDAAIVQDVGICRLIRRISPDFPIHISTQMTISSPAGMELARDLGASLVVLARENSLSEIKATQEAQSANGKTPLDIEVFVHGALCVAYSGQCLTSEALGGRSANRGECAQACRLPYDLYADGRKVDLGDRRYLLSPRDLAGIDLLPQLVEAGVASLKIEGRLKSAEYVASITRVYRKALDQCLNKITRSEQESREAHYELEMSFSRGMDSGWFEGSNNKRQVHARFGTKRGVFLGKVIRVDSDSVTIRTEENAPLKPGDGIVFDAGKPEAGEEGGRVYEVTPEKTHGEVTLRFGRGSIDFRKIFPGNLVWKTNDPALDRDVQASFKGDNIRHQRPLNMKVSGEPGRPLRILFDDGEGHSVEMQSAMPLIPAKERGIDSALLEKQLGRLGNTPFRLGKLSVNLDSDLMLPPSELNRMRRSAVERLEQLRAQPRHWAISEAAAAPAIDKTPSTGIAPSLIAVVRSLPQLEAAIEFGKLSSIYCEFEKPRHYRDAVSRFREAKPDNVSIWVAPPRIFKPGEEWILKQVRSSEADGYLVRNAEHLSFFKGERLRGDFSLNIANEYSAAYWMQERGLERITASYDLNASQLEALLQAAPGEWFDITLHQHMPMFHMEHCVFCAFLSDGKDYHDCGRPCEKHRVSIRDRIGADLPLRADAGCRNTVFNNRAQSGAEYAQRFIDKGARFFRIEFLDESHGECVETLESYASLLKGKLPGSELWRRLKVLNQLGVTRGQLSGK